MNICIFSFSLTEIQNESGIKDYFFGTGIGGLFGLLIYLMDAQTVSVSLEGQLIRASTGTILSEANISETVNVKRSVFGRKHQSLPMIEVAAVKLLRQLRREALL